MKTNILALSLLAAILAFTACQKWEEVEKPEILEGTLVIDSVVSHLTMPGSEEVRYMLVYLPPNYDTTKRYPVIYLLHGYGGNHMTLQAVEDVKSIADYLISTGAMPEAIIVTPDASNDLGGSFYTNSMYNSIPVFGLFENYIIYEVIPHIDSTYSTIASQEGRAIVGISMGGYGAAKLGIKHSDMFKAIGIHSGPVSFERFLDPIPDFGGNLIDIILAENGGELHYPDVLQRLGPDYPFTTMLFAQAAAFTPKLDMFENFDTLNCEFPLASVTGDTCGPGMLCVGVRLPFDYQGNTNDLLDVWLTEHNPRWLLDQYADQLSANGVAFYVDCGAQDELFLTSHAQDFAEGLEQHGLTYESEIFADAPGYPADEFPPLHSTHFQLRLKNSLIFVGQYLATQ